MDLFLSTFGLLGVAVFFTLKMERAMVTTLKEPVWLPLELILPRPGSPLPEGVRQTLWTAHYQQFSLVVSTASTVIVQLVQPVQFDTFIFSMQAIGTRPAARVRAWSPAGPMSDDVPELFSKEAEAFIINMSTLQTAIQDVFFSCGLSKASWAITEYASRIVNMFASLDVPEVGYFQ